MHDKSQLVLRVMGGRTTPICTRKVEYRLYPQALELPPASFRSRISKGALLIDNPDTCSPGRPSAKSLHCSLRDFPYLSAP
ncbi:hypothetical protein EYF80_005209 [Liparis tanakae]|uniref:Uncharacterized protein n=1 Tax=Liparis tanakae TaxID=230148 RepID=A0A4Z2J2S1_9TELE|nr:hypothetical protein EYF80_005209 [Liparis tanakae]